MHTFRAAQPALLYLSPACILSVSICARARGEWSDLWAYVDGEADEKERREKEEKEKREGETGTKVDGVVDGKGQEKGEAAGAANASVKGAAVTSE